jgi:hypothetical protein
MARITALIYNWWTLSGTPGVVNVFCKFFDAEQAKAMSKSFPQL